MLRPAMFEGTRPTQVAFAQYRSAVRAWLAAASHPDAALVAAADLLDGRPELSEDEATQLLVHAADAHTALGAGVLLDLRQHICANS